MTYCSKSTLEERPNLAYVAKSVLEKKKKGHKPYLQGVGGLNAKTVTGYNAISSFAKTRGANLCKVRVGGIDLYKNQESEEGEWKDSRNTYSKRRERVGVAEPKPSLGMERILQMVAIDELLDRWLQQHQPRKDKTWTIFFEGQGLH
jgi:hypothetical protein